MKKNMILGVFALMFAVATAFATTSRSTQPVYYFLDEEEQTGCTEWNVNSPCIPGPGICHEITPDGDRQLYDEGCQIPLKLNTGF